VKRFKISKAIQRKSWKIIIGISKIAIGKFRVSQEVKREITLGD